MMAVEKGNGYEVVPPQPASYDHFALAHAAAHITSIARDTRLFEMASLAVGGAILASEIAFHGEPAFACIRPPGHHASRNSTWGYCAFCNIGIALLKLKAEGRIESAFLLDFDAHTGDGNIDVLSDWEDAAIVNPFADNNKDYLKVVEHHIPSIQYVDIVAASAGFDNYERDLGKKLKTSDFYFIRNLLHRLWKRMGHRRCFATLEGGYYLPDLGENVLAFCQGLEG